MLDDGTGLSPKHGLASPRSSIGLQAATPQSPGSGSPRSPPSNRRRSMAEAPSSPPPEDQPEPIRIRHNRRASVGTPVDSPEVFGDIGAHQRRRSRANEAFSTPVDSAEVVNDVGAHQRRRSRASVDAGSGAASRRASASGFASPGRDLSSDRRRTSERVDRSASPAPRGSIAAVQSRPRGRFDEDDDAPWEDAEFLIGDVDGEYPTRASPTPASPANERKGRRSSAY
jgi:hypothetical protein